MRTFFKPVSSFTMAKVFWLFGKWLCGLPAWFAPLVFACLPANGQEANSSTSINREYTIKAAFLYQFSMYVAWSDEAFPSASAPFVVGVYQTNPFGQSLDTIARTKKVGKRSLEIRNIKSPNEVRACHILFIPRSVAAAEQQAVLQATHDSFVFVVGETGGFIERGGHAEFFLDGNKLRFAFSDKAAERHDLKISPKLLALAVIKATP